MLDIRQHLSLCRAIAPELIGHDHTRHILQAPEQPFEEPVRCLRISTGLDQYVEHDAVLIHRTREIVQFTLDPKEDLVQISYVDGPLLAR